MMNSNSMVIHRFNPDIASVKDIAGIFYRSVHAIPDAIYSKEQKSAWAPDCVDLNAWHQRVVDHPVWVAVDERNNECLGFLALDDEGDIDCLYVCPRAQRLGVAKSLIGVAWEFVDRHYKEKETWQVSVSDAAYEFFLNLGFLPNKRNELQRFGVSLSNTTMSKAI